MKKIGLIFAGCLAFIGVYGAHAEDAGDAARAAIRRASSGITANQSRQKSSDTVSGTNAIRGNTTTATHATQNVRGRNTTTQNRTQNVVERVSNTTPRTTGNVVSRATVASVAPRTTTPTTTNTTRSATRSGTSSVQGKSASRSVARSGTNDTVTRDDILNRNYSKCKTVFFDCMDEFCANKDSQLKRCACSSRINEFDAVKKQLDAAEDKMLDFNQRLLTVSMEKEDAEALSVATEGETAYLATTDKSDSKKTLDAIAQKLKTNFDTSSFNSDLNVLSWSLNMDSAFDNVDSLLGASTTTKSGTELYSAALPVCRQMAAEVCAESDISLAEGGYLALIEQDCNTVAKTYKTQAAQARSKVLEGSALLDMSRLDVYQKRNSDDILTCKRKMLDMLTDSTICGENLSKCLDTTGKYIDPATGEVFLKPELVELSNLLTRPDDGSTWTSMAKNSAFVSFLDSKKKFLEPAMENCENIADDVWDGFVEDALAQIKLAQEQKLNDVRQSCTVLTAQCLAEAEESITQFDARALSVFGIDADRTKNAMCADVIQSCTALLNTTNDNGNTWNSGVADITLATTYETLMQTCRQVGRACIIQVCTSTSGNFGLCENISTSVNRKTIINRNACWQDVVDCIANAGDTAINDIIEKQLGFGANAANSSINFYDYLYGSYTLANNDNTASCTTDGNSSCVYDICADKCTSTSDKVECRKCRLAERIWGNCETSPATILLGATQHNQIKQGPSDEQTLLYWFATNTGTENALDNCRDTTCPVGYTSIDGVCVHSSDMCVTSYAQQNTDDNLTMCSLDTRSYPSFNDSSKFRCMCCDIANKDTAGNCCDNGRFIYAKFETAGIFPNDSYIRFCSATGNGTVITEPYMDDTGGSLGRYHVLICDGANAQSGRTAGTVYIDSGGQPMCNGTLVDVLVYPYTENGVKKYNFYYQSPTYNTFVSDVIMDRDLNQYKWMDYTYPSITNYGCFDETTRDSCSLDPIISGDGSGTNNLLGEWSVAFTQ
ncbi:MAG: hypothetical protein J5679_01975 [Alphaproteobacteria bacterium]|nr:hypothetical protein [Alphaproteobacteria bacterium]